MLLPAPPVLEVELLVVIVVVVVVVVVVLCQAAPLTVARTATAGVCFVFEGGSGGGPSISLRR